MFGWDYFSIGWLFDEAKLNSMQKKKRKACLALPKQCRFYLDLREIDGGKEAFRQGAMLTLPSTSIINPRQYDTGQHKYVLPEPGPCHIHW